MTDIQKEKENRLRILGIIAVVLLAMALGGCGGSKLGGKTLYSLSPVDEEATTITFDKDGSWHGTGSKSEATGAWKEEGDNVVLTTASGWVAFTLAPAGDGAWQLVGGEDWERYYPSEGDAKDAAEAFVDDAQSRVQTILEETEWVSSSDDRMGIVEAETITFSAGEATFHKAEYEDDWYEPKADTWRSSDHSGPYTVTVEKPGADRYKGTLGIGDSSTDFSLTITDGKASKLYLEGGASSFQPAE